jgi:signal transduction histidine kinase
MRLITQLSGFLILTLLPTLGLAVYHDVARHREQAMARQQTVLVRAEMIAAALNQSTRSLRQDLAMLDDGALAQWPHEEARRVCQQRVHALRQTWPQAVEIGIRTARGHTVCAESTALRPLKPLNNAKDPVALRQRAQESPAPSWLELAHPIARRHDLGDRFIAYARLDMARWARDLPPVFIAPDQRIIMADRHGRILLHHPPPPQVPVTLPAAWHTRLHHPYKDVVEDNTLPGPERQTIGFIPITQTPQQILIAVGMRQTEASEAGGALSTVTMIYLLFGVAVTVLFVWHLHHRALTAPVRHLLHTLSTWQEGAIAARVNLSGNTELAAIGRGIDRLFDELQQRDLAQQQRRTTLQKERDAALAASAAKTRFMAAASHDLRQPLHAFAITVAALANHHAALDPHEHPLIARLQRGVGTLTELVEELLDLARLEAGHIQAKREPVPVTPLLHSVAEEFRPLAEAHQLALDVIECALHVRTDRALLGTMLRNLVANAVKFTPAGGRVTLSATGTPQDVTISVRDTGMGIPLEHQQTIFEEFRQLSAAPSLSGQGLGLGLSIVQRLSVILDHPVSVESRPGAGATFSLRLPRVFST